MRPLTACALCILALFAATAAAQQGRNQPDRVRTGPDEIAGVPFSNVPYRVESLGLSLRLPEGATVSSTSTTGGVRSFMVAPPENNWLLRVLGPRVADPELTPADIADSMIRELLDPEGERATMDRMKLQTQDGRKRVFDRLDDYQTSTASGARFYVSVKQPSGEEIVTGYTIFRPAPGQLLVFELSTLGPEFPKVRPLYEAIVASAEIRDPAELAGERAAGLTAGQTVLADLDAEAIERLVPLGPEWIRLFRPGSTGRWSDDEEVAYQFVEVKRGARGDLATGRSKRSWSAAEREQGFVARLVARYLDGDQTIDIMSLYFLSTDGDSEAWSVNMQIRDRFESTRWTETGVRAGDEIRVSIAQPDGTVTEKTWPTPPDGYLSHVEALLLPRFLASRGVEGEFAYYRYNSQLSELSLRRDDFSADGAGWRLVTRSHEDAPRETLELGPEGELVTMRIEGDVVGKPVDREHIARIWRHKGLPID